jgi:hypothetical protein
MKTRGNMSAVIDGLQGEHGLLAAYLEATDKIGWRALHKPHGDHRDAQTGQCRSAPGIRRTSIA